ncbi:GEVED domain-containing protein [Dyadobacter jejuensis]|uniref:GEVED domain-containing protein n=1 Tax=Dyadobacter jejuensis TaxID=1082580 RepID=UPI001304ECC7|nr:GEVED domain-containing protein [Dyadobacter jejuensis]
MDKYSDYTTLVAAPIFNQLATIPFSVQIASSYNTHTAIWIDYNHNGTFESASERVFQTTGGNFGSYTLTGSFTIPITALTGNTRMRVITSYGSTPLNSGCENYSYGETEDYLVNIVIPPACSGSPIQTNTIATQNEACPTVSFTFSLSPSITTTGNTYQWYNNAGLIAGATSATYTATITRADNFYCKVTCPTGAKTTASTPVAIHDPYLYCSCSSASNAANGDKIFNVKIGTLDNSSTCDPTGGPGSIQYRYSNYTTIPAPDLKQLNPIPFSIELGPCGSISVSSTSIWIDYNHNGSFDAPGERVYNSGVSLNKPLTLTGAIIIPESALKGLTRMRVIIAKGESIPQASACGSYEVGETEDYFVNIVEPVYCSGVPAPGNTIASQTTACLNTNIDLSYSSSSTLNDDAFLGLTYQWFNSAGAIPGATKPTYTATITAADEFYCKVKCSQSGQTGQSTPVAISLKTFDKCYCTSMATSTGGLDIYNVTAGTLNNSTTLSQTGGPGSILNRYSDFTTLVSAPVFSQLATIPFSVQIGASNYYSQTSIWIDYNHNGTFEDPGERVFQSTGVNSGSYTQNGSFTIPLIALTGITRMRVVTIEGLDPANSACENYINGETEDYIINIAAATPCNGPPIQTATIATPVCTESKHIFSLSPLITTTGNMYQWYNNAGLIAGATHATYTTTITGSDSFYCKITCPNGNKTTTSTPVAVIKCYCASMATNTGQVEIFNVTAGTLNNSSDDIHIAGPGSVLDKYSDYTTIVAAPVFNQLATIPFSVQIRSSYYTHTAIWIDYNHNRAFDSPEELAYQTAGGNFGTYTLTGSFTIPITALTGDTRMRVITSYGSTPLNSACENYTYGETEDYLVNIAVPPACSGSPIQTNTIATQNPVCPTVSFTFSLSPLITTTGNTYQWYNDAGLIAGATNQTLTATITKADNFYCKVTCPNANKTTTSTPVAVREPYLYCPCVSISDTPAYEDIVNVTVGSLTNSSDCNQTGGPGSALQRFSDYTTLVSAPNLAASNTIPFSVTTGACGGFAGTSISIWIDYNHNGVFDAPIERVFNSDEHTFAISYTASGSFVIPAGTLPGLTRMRIICARDGGLPMLSACGEYGAGETEDYYVNILAPVQCNGLPEPGNTIASQTTVCLNSSIDLSLSLSTPDGHAFAGLTYQWFNNAGAIEGATKATYTATITATDAYYCKVTCVQSGQTGQSTPVAISLKTFDKCYCTSGATATRRLEIYNVTAGTLNNSSNDSQTGGPGSILNRYSDYTTVVAAPVFNQLATIPFSVQNGASDFYSHTSIWIDYNRNGAFESPGELVYQTTAIIWGNYTASGSFRIPITASTGITRMRIVTNYGSDPISSPCENYIDGETEDYLVNIAVPPACSGAPIQTNTIATQNQVCPTVSFTFSLSPLITTTGNTYQWYNDAGLIAGATNDTYTATITKADNFYCKVTCPNGNKTTTSTPVAIEGPYLYCSCVSTATTSEWEEIYNVTVGGLNNSSDCNLTGGVGSVLNKYSDYTRLVAAPELPILGTIPFSIATGRCGVGNYFSTSIWIDFNHNGVFDAPEERVYNSPSYVLPNEAPISGSFTVPRDALTGLTRMRIISARDGGLPMASACGEYSAGETEDYFVNIVPTPACSGSPIPMKTVATSVCPESTYTFSLSPFVATTGNTFQWYNDAGLIAGATNETYTTTITSPDNFYCKVTCPNGNQTTTSAPVAVLKCYCPSIANGAESIDIYNVTAGTLNNSSNSSQTGGPGSILNRYSDFTTLVAAPVFNQLATIPFSVEIGASTYFTQTSIWIDYNRDGAFDSPGELAYQSTGQNFKNYTQTGTFTIPGTSLTGSTRMRIITSEGIFPVNSACENYSNGETEDYLVDIAVPLVCSGSPVQMNTIATQNPVDSEVNFTFSLSPLIATSGNTYQWYNDAGLIAGATNETYSSTITKADHFYCKVTCPNGNLTTASTPVTVLAPYLYSSCVSGPTDLNYEKIFNVTVGTLNNSSNCDQTGGPGSVLRKYADYTTLVSAPDLPIIATIPFSILITACNAYGPMATSMWIDFNHNGVFDAPDERVFSSPSYPLRPSYTESGSFIVPANALPGLTRMRVITARDGALPMTSACGEYTKGETEDYFVNIVLPDCSDTPTAGNTVVSQNNVCASTSITLSLSSPPANTKGITYQWFNNGGAIIGATDANLTTTISTTDLFYCEVSCTNSALKVSSTPITINVIQVSLPTAATTNTQNVATTPLIANDCQYIAKVVPTTGFTIATVKSWLETTPPFSYVPRHYEITPNTSPDAATGTITLYFTQADFNAYNGTLTNGLLPTSPSDLSKIANFQIIKYAGTSPTGLGYTGSPTYIPGEGKVWNVDDHTFVWNAANSIWEVTFPVTGFSGFLAKSISQPLPVTLIYFTGKATEKDTELNWKTSSEVNFSHFEIQRSTNARVFEKIGKQVSNESGNYMFLDSDAPNGNAYYRLKMIDLDGTYSFSKIIAIDSHAETAMVGDFYPNPSTGKASIEINALETGTWTITTYDLSGRVISVKSNLLQIGLNKISIEKLNPGINFVKFENGFISEIRKVIKE